MWIVYLLVLIIILGFLVLVHELGHFLVAKKCGVHIYEFSIGMGPILHKHIGKDNIQYSIRALPIGGYVQMAGEVTEDDDNIKKEDFMCNKKWWQRILILIAGVTMNFITAFILLFVIAFIWGASSTDPVVTSVMENSAYAEAGGLAGDTILEVDGKKTSTWDRAQVLLILSNDTGYYNIKVRHENGNEETLKVTPKDTVLEDGTSSRVFGISVVPTIEKGLIPSLKYAFSKFTSIYQSMFTIIGGLFTGRISTNSLSGPVGIYSIVEQSFALGLSQLLYLTAYISINLGFMNLLPFPAFDGGHIVFVLIEKLRGKPVDKNIEGWFHAVGFMLLMILMIYITIKDIIRLF